jgi:nucleoside-diphosphate-sugar epimerase
MTKALVLGASGSMGYAITNELLNREIQVTAFARSQSKLERLFKDQANVTIVAGDAFHIDKLREASQNIDIIYHALGIPYYEWEEILIPLLHNILTVAKDVNAKLVVVDNIYSYGRGHGELIDENFPKQPHTKKGKIRLKQEQIIKQSGVPYLIAHFPDFYGPYAENSLLHETFQRVILNQKTIFVGNPNIPREYIYTLDGAHALVELSLRNHTYGQNWNIPGYGVISGNEILQILRRHGYSKRMTTISKFMVQIGGVFNKMLKEYTEMYYLNESPVILSGEKLKMELGDTRQTSYEIGIFNTLDQMKPFREFS